MVMELLSWRGGSPCLVLPDASDLVGLLAYIRCRRLIEKVLYDEAFVDDGPWNLLKVNGQTEQNPSDVDIPTPEPNYLGSSLALSTVIYWHFLCVN